MNFPTEIAELEAELHQVRRMCEDDEKALSESATPQVARIFLGSTNALRLELEKRLRQAKQTATMAHP